ncbi:glycosyltransferase [Clostridium sp. SM-530-WT-3G]|uniref:glycosyltransferase family 2 protein n=1 Tax=Clostridium sp. SM-530-WT-3G TaxID=2725303 RepID=UPI00145EFCCA|nr:glycosyltransferase [Clostridium sp. SM-530-WT-3G]NME83736.1 glycosyltransferase [Clostridium sp. SM-530-WT-3G]
MDNKPLISIIICIYNGEKYIKECIQSVVDQDYEKLEIILVNDGSTDNSGKIVDEFLSIDNRIKAIHQKNSGVCNSRNIAMYTSQGEYICIIDQDDIISKDYISYFYGLCKKYNAEIALTPTVDKFFGELHESTSKDDIRILTGQQTTIEMLYHKIAIGPWNKMISRKLIVENGLRFNPNFFNGEGFAFSVECYQRADRVAVGKRRVYHYRVGDPESGASKFKEAYINSSINAQQYIKDTFVTETRQLLKAWEFSNWHTHCDCLNIMVGCGVIKKYPEMYKNLKKVCQEQAQVALKAPIAKQQKFRGILFKINPYMAAKVINHFRIRKFSKDN